MFANNKRKQIHKMSIKHSITRNTKADNEQKHSIFCVYKPGYYGKNTFINVKIGRIALNDKVREHCRLLNHLMGADI